MNKFIPLLLLIVVLSTSCSQDSVEDLSSRSNDPSIETPRVESFTGESMINISWTEDESVDEYILYRCIEGSDEYEIVYQGNVPFYSDVNVIDQKRYLYRLVKRRGEESFGPSATAMGIGSIVTRDEYEPNDSESTATDFESNPLSVNTYYYVSQGEEHTVMDIDWYSIRIRAGMTASFKVTLPSAESSGSTGLYSNILFGARSEITNGSEIEIENTSSEKKTFYFSIYPNGMDIVVDNSTGGGKIITYSILYLGETLNDT